MFAKCQAVWLVWHPEQLLWPFSDCGNGGQLSPLRPRRRQQTLCVPGGAKTLATAFGRQRINWVTLASSVKSGGEEEAALLTLHIHGYPAVNLKGDDNFLQAETDKGTQGERERRLPGWGIFRATQSQGRPRCLVSLGDLLRHGWDSGISKGITVGIQFQIHAPLAPSMGPIL